MLDSFISVNEGTSSPTESRKSVFFCHLKMTQTVEEADQFIRDMKKEYKGYTNASAYIVGDSGEHQRARDNGEPSGSAGIPILEALKKHKVIHATAVVTRHWGGQLLGANRLKIHYGGAVDKAILELGLAEWRLQQEISFIVDYSYEGLLQNELAEMEGVLLRDVSYLDKVHFSVTVDFDDVDQFQADLLDLTAGTAHIQLGADKYMPFPLKEEK